ncbi:hypothetical protein BDR07DRAFT_1379684 [Suillus spraguei]|nr:hypothetical protein BDR07DRAFT_1379684 [Suillus spraguei]
MSKEIGRTGMWLLKKRGRKERERWIAMGEEARDGDQEMGEDELRKKQAGESNRGALNCRRMKMNLMEWAEAQESRHGQMASTARIELSKGEEEKETERRGHRKEKNRKTHKWQSRQKAGEKDGETQRIQGEAPKMSLKGSQMTT